MLPGRMVHLAGIGARGHPSASVPQTWLNPDTDIYPGEQDDNVRGSAACIGNVSGPYVQPADL
jgi:hypothetical protein